MSRPSRSPCLALAQAALVPQMEWNVRRVLASDTSAISTLRCLKLYLERLGANFLDADTVAALAGAYFPLVGPQPPSRPSLTPYKRSFGCDRGSCSLGRSCAPAHRAGPGC